MKVSIRVATESDVAATLANVSDRTQAEFDVAGIDPELAVERAMYRGDDMFVSVSDGCVLTLFGFRDYPTYKSMWTIATTAFFDLGVPGVLCTRRFFSRLRVGKPVVVVTTSPHRDTDRWLGLLGFEKIGGDNRRREFRLR